MPIALAVVLMIFLGVASGLIIITLMGGFDGIGAGDDDGEPTVPPTLVVTEPPAAPTVDSKKTPAPLESPGRPQEFECSQARLRGPSGTRWRVAQVSFRTFRDYDRVVYHLERSGATESGIRPLAHVTRKRPGEIPLTYIGVDPPLVGDTAVMVGLYNGVRDGVQLRHFEPNGTRVVKELSTYAYQSHPNWSPGEDPWDKAVGLTSPVGVLGEGCFALRAPAWRARDAADRDRADIFVDIERTASLATPRPETTPKPIATPAPGLTIPPPSGIVPGPPTAYVCGLRPEQFDAFPDTSEWRLRQVSFRTFRDYDRVILHLRRSGDGPDVASARAVRLEEPPRTGQTEVVVSLDGVADRTRLDGYQPRGMKIVKRISTTGSGAEAQASIRVQGQGCFQLRVPDWQLGDSLAPDDVDVYIDFEN